MDTRRQTRLQFHRQAKKNATPAATPPITTLLSQYELLTTLCKHLSSADIIHLGATSTEHWQYVTGSPKLLKALVGSSSCNGTGIIAQARVFGYWDAKPEKAARKCRGKDARPCHDCGAMVCNMCRFHIQYPTWGPYVDGTAEHLEYYEQEMWDEEWESDERHLSDCIVEGDITSDDFRGSVKTVKADEMFGSQMCMSLCVDCQPLIFKPHYLDKGPICDCGYIFGHFCKEWRCIPCVLVEEAKLVTQRQKFTPHHRYFLHGKYHYGGDIFCACGKLIVEEGLQTCGFCGKMNGWYEGHREFAMECIHVQLGTLLDGRADDPILSQLG